MEILVTYNTGKSRREGKSKESITVEPDRESKRERERERRRRRMVGGIIKKKEFVDGKGGKKREH